MILLVFGMILFIMLWQKQKQDAKEWENGCDRWKDRVTGKQKALDEAWLEELNLAQANALQQSEISLLKKKVGELESNNEILESDETLLGNLMQYLQLVKDHDRDRRDRVCQEIEEMLLMDEEKKEPGTCNYCGQSIVWPCRHSAVEK